MKTRWYFIAHILLCFFCSTAAFAATSVTQISGGLDVGSGGIPTLPGREITPEEMQQHFPAPLKGSAQALPFIPDAAPLIPVLSLDKKSETPENTVPYPSSPTAPSFSPSLSMEPLPPKPSTASSGTDNTEKSPEQKNLEEHFRRALQPSATVGQHVDEAALGQAVISTDPSPTGFPALEVMIGQMVLAGFTGLEVERQSPIVKLITAGKVGGVFLEPVPVQKKTSNQEDLLAMAPTGMPAQQSAHLLAQVGLPGNVASPLQVRRLIATLQSFIPEKSLPLWVAIEQEGGTAQTLRPDLGFTGLMSAARLGQDSVEQTEIAARRAGLEMGGLGINMALGPAGDVNVNPLSEHMGQRFRSFGSDAQKVTEHVLAFGRGLRAAKVLPCLRNFPGTGSYVRGFAPVAAATQSPSGQKNILENIPDISGTWQQRELSPYVNSLSLQAEAGAISKDATQNRFPVFALQPALVYHRGYDAMRPVPLSTALLQNMVRQQWQFEGLIVSQDLRALQPFFSLEESILQSVLAGVDILLISEPPAMVNPASSPLAGLGVLSSLPGMGNMEALVGLMQKNTSETANEGDKSEEELVQMLLQNQAGQMLSGIPGAENIPGLSQFSQMSGMAAQVQAKPLTGLATEAEKVYAILLQLVKSGRISEARIGQSWLRIHKTKQSLGLMAY